MFFVRRLYHECRDGRGGHGGGGTSFQIVAQVRYTCELVDHLKSKLAAMNCQDDPMEIDVDAGEDKARIPTVTEPAPSTKGKKPAYKDNKHTKVGKAIPFGSSTTSSNR